MKDDVELTREDRVANLKGMGCARKRVEDARFTQGVTKICLAAKNNLR